MTEEHEPRWWLVAICGLCLMGLGSPGAAILGITVWLIGMIQTAGQWDQKRGQFN